MFDESNGLFLRMCPLNIPGAAPDSMDTLARIGLTGFINPFNFQHNCYTRLSKLKADYIRPAGSGRSRAKFQTTTAKGDG